MIVSEEGNSFWGTGVSRKYYFSLITFLNTWNFVLCACITSPKNRVFFFLKIECYGISAGRTPWGEPSFFHTSTLFSPFAWKGLYPSFLHP